MANFFAIGSNVGVDLANAGTTQLFSLGTTVEGNRDSVWVYVQASTAVTAYTAVAMSTAAAMGMASVFDVGAGLQLGVAQTAFSAEEYGWIPIKGSPLNVLVAGSGLAGNAMYINVSTNATGITASSASATGTLIGAVYLSVNDSTATVTVGTCVLTYPMAKTIGERL